MLDTPVGLKLKLSELRIIDTGSSPVAVGPRILFPFHLPPPPTRTPGRRESAAAHHAREQRASRG